MDPTRTLEDRLAELDPQARKHNGVYYTPMEAVGFLCRSIAGLVSTRFLADDVVVVDPACGDGRFLKWLASQGDLQSSRLVGTDIMPEAVEISRSNLQAVDRISWRVECLNPLVETSECEELLGDPTALIVIGNPPYSNFGLDRCVSPELDEWLACYKSQLNERKTNLNDLYIRFIGWAHRQIERVGRGAIAFVTNHTFLSGPTYRVMRQRLMQSFDMIRVLDLHGNSSRRERTPSGDRDENLFDIRTGVAMTIAIKEPTASHGVQHAEIWGTRSHKLEYLESTDMDSIAWLDLSPSQPRVSFLPSLDSNPQYELGWPLDRVFAQYVSGVQTKYDALFVAFSPDQLCQQVKQLWEGKEVGRFPSWLESRARGRRFDERFIRPYLVAPFDLRWIYYDPELIGRARYNLLRHLDSRNIALIFMRQSTNAGPYDHFLCTRHLASDRCFYSAQGAPFLAPLFVEDGRPNFSPEFCEAMSKRTAVSLSPYELFCYIVAQTASPAYRQRNQASLRMDFPRIPLPIDNDQFRKMVAYGEQLIPLQAEIRPCRLADSDGPSQPAGMPKHVGESTIGGYPVVRRWLRQRKDRDLSGDERTYLDNLCHSLVEMERIAAEIDENC